MLLGYEGMAESALQHFNLIKPLEGGGGVYFEAEDLLRGQPAIVHLFQSGGGSPAPDVAWKLLENPHPNLFVPIEVSTNKNPPFAAYETVRGFRLLDVLRRHRGLSLPDIMRIVQQLAAAVDHAVDRGLAGLDLQLASVWITFDPSVSKEEIAGFERALPRTWPNFSAKVASYGSRPGIKPPVASEAGASAWALRARYIHSLAAVTYELLGGARLRDFSGEPRYAPLPGLYQAGNLALRKALNPGTREPFASATAFVDALRDATEFMDRKLTSQASFSERSPYAGSEAASYYSEVAPGGGGGESRPLLWFGAMGFAVIIGAITLLFLRAEVAEVLPQPLRDVVPDVRKVLERPRVARARETPAVLTPRQSSTVRAPAAAPEAAPPSAIVAPPEPVADLTPGPQRAQSPEPALLTPSPNGTALPTPDGPPSAQPQPTQTPLPIETPGPFR